MGKKRGKDKRSKEEDELDLTGNNKSLVCVCVFRLIILLMN